LLKDCSEIKVEFPWMAEEFEADAFILLPGAILPDEKDTVVELELL